MSNQRKFSYEALFSAFLSHEHELSALFTEFGVPISSPFTIDDAHNALVSGNSAEHDKLTSELYKLNDLASKKGSVVIKSIIEQFKIPGPHPNPSMTRERAALWLRRSNQSLFEHALDCLAVDGLQGTTMGLFQGRLAIQIQDPTLAVADFEKQLTGSLSEWKGAESFILRHYMDQNLLVIMVFCERTAEVQREMDHSRGKVMTSIRRPVIQDVLFYNTSTGELEIEAGQPSHREILRKSFAVGVMGDDSFFPQEEFSRVLQLQKLLDQQFSLPTRGNHSAKITGIKVRKAQGKKFFTSEHSCSRTDVIELLGWDRTDFNAPVDTKALGKIESVRIELTLGDGRSGLKTIELSGNNRIKFNRSTHSETVYEYLRAWNLMRAPALAEEAAA